MDTPIFIEREGVALPAPVRKGSSRNPLRILQRNWRKAALIAAAPGNGWLLAGFLAVDAFVLGARTVDNQSEMTPVSAIAGIPFHVARGMGCHCGRWFPRMLAKRDAAGAWTILPQATAEEIFAQHDLISAGALMPDTAVVQVGRATASTIGLWSPLVHRERGRPVTVAPLDSRFTAADEASVRKAAVAAWRQDPSAPAVELSPPTESEVAAALTGSSDEQFSLRPLAAANDAAVAGALGLFLASQPRRYRRRQRAALALAQPQPITHCPDCRYDLAGLTTDEYGERTCPECGRVCGQVP